MILNSASLGSRQSLYTTQSFNRLLLSVFLYTPALIHANHYGFDETTLIKHLNTKDGLSNMRVFSVVKDIQVKILFSTRSWIDSYTVTNITHYNLNNTNLLPYSYVGL